MNEWERSLEIFRNAGIVVYPTDTAFGIGCRLDDDKAIQKLFEIRKRPHDMATPVLCSSIEMAERIGFVENINARRLMEEYWPGALTIILKLKDKNISPLVTGGTGTIGLRIPNYKELVDTIDALGIPILGPSANFHGEKTPHKFEEIDQKLLKMVDFAVHGKTKIGGVSTVIDCTNDQFKIIRQGVVKVYV